MDSIKDGLRSISLAARKAPSVGLAHLVTGVIEKMLRLSDHECKGGVFRGRELQKKFEAISCVTSTENLIFGSS